MNMNKEQQSLNELRNLVHSELDGTSLLNEHLEYCDTLQELVDKATPKKPEQFGNNEYCPKCHYLGHRFYKYCPYCGQALDWSDNSD